ncbi:hypothetical protein [Tenacibaculum ovolyticum]|uniref:hypothetical protein n=1 Tax=Tenacibaculum ovolyticum TaxID=104270 RepID=UPI001F2E36BD|nr:hypothetical protein [Tenacibaculum ovolyticum]
MSSEVIIWSSSVSAKGLYIYADLKNKSNILFRLLLVGFYGYSLDYFIISRIVMTRKI